MASQREIGLVVDGATLYYAMQPSCKLDFLELACASKVVVACRTAPLQKAEVVALVKENRDVMTLSIGACRPSDSYSLFEIMVGCRRPLKWQPSGPRNLHPLMIPPTLSFSFLYKATAPTTSA